MTQDSPDDTRSTAIGHLEALGLSAYAARTLVALVCIGSGTAKDVNAVSDVPRTRVYDAVDELRSMGLVDVRESNPKQFSPVSVETTTRRFDRQYTRRVDRLSEALDDLESASRAEEQRGVWTVTGRDVVTDRVIDFIEEATDEIVFMTVGELLTEETVERLEAATRRGVSVRLAGISRDVEDDIRDEVPGVETFQSLWVWSETSAGRFLLVDREKTLVSVLTAGDGEDGPVERHRGDRNETAIWGTGRSNSLVVVLRAMFTWQLDRSGTD